MIYKEQKKFKRNIFLRIIFSKIFIVLCLVVLAFSSVSLGKEMIRRYKINKEINSLASEIQKIEKENFELGQMIEYLKTETFLENEARLKMGYSKSNEKVVIVPDPNKTQNEASIGNSSQNADVEKSSNLIKWFDYFWRN